VAQPPTAPRGTAAALPTGTGLDAVDVTVPVSPSSIDPQLLPPGARGASSMAGLTVDQRICIDATIHGTVEGDPSVVDDQARLAGVIGRALALCAGEAFTTTMIDGLTGELGLDAGDAACVRDELTTDPDLRAQLLGAIATASIAQLDDALSPIEDACGFTLDD